MRLSYHLTLKADADIWTSLCLYDFVRGVKTMPNNSCSMKNALISVLGLADVGVLHGKAAQCIDKEILISKNGTIDIDIDNRMF